MDQRECTPDVVRVAVHQAAESRSFERAAAAMKLPRSHGVSAKTIERLVKDVAPELAALNERTTSDQEVLAPEVAVVSCDGGRIMTRAADSAPGVHDKKWKETKNASFEKMVSPTPSETDPCPALPNTFRDPAHVANIAEKAALSVTCEEKDRPKYKGPERVLRTCLSSMACSDEFGRQMRREAQRRKFDEAPRRVFIGDGLPWNWKIWRTQFRDSTPILDFIHVVEYLYKAAVAWESTDAQRWARYLVFCEAIWQGRSPEVVEALEAELSARGVSLDKKLADDNPHKPLFDTARYLRNNASRMDYPRYRREGLPITSSPMESLIRQINLRVKGTEMFWGRPEGAEAMLQVTAAHLSEDGRLSQYLTHRPGSPHTRRTTPTAAT